MRSYLFRLAAALLALAAALPASADSGKALPAIQFDTESHTFSPVLEGDIVRRVFAFENRGRAELRITRVRTD